MKPEQWNKIIDEASLAAAGLIVTHAGRLHEAYVLGQNKVELAVTIVITSEGAYSASVVPSISFAVKWAEKAQGTDVIYGQQQIPGMPDATRSGRGGKGGGR